jgi:hypothetical protein
MNEHQDSIPRAVYGLTMVAIFALAGALLAIWRRVCRT